jgi:hypothetical protein
MYTLYDYITYIKGVEYLLALGFITGFLLLNELLKAKPFGTLKAMWKEDAGYLKANHTAALKTIGRIASAPFIGLAYVVALPFAFTFAIGSSIGRTAAPAFSFGWRPVEAYLTGRKKKKVKK